MAKTTHPVKVSRLYEAQDLVYSGETPTDVVQAVAMYDKAGVLVGYMPVYTDVVAGWDPSQATESGSHTVHWWLKADAGTFEDDGKTTPAADDGDVVGAWADQSGNGYDVLQATTAKKPTLKLSIQNGLPVIRFDGSDDILVHSANVLTGTTGTLFAVIVTPGSLSNDDIIIASGDEASATDNIHVRIYDQSGTPSMAAVRVGGGADVVYGSTTISTSTAYLFMWQSDGASYIFRLNGSAETESVRAGSNSGDWFGDLATTDNATIGAVKRSSEGNHQAADVCEIVYYDGDVLDSTDIDQLETYLNDRWAVY